MLTGVIIRALPADRFADHASMISLHFGQRSKIFKLFAKIIPQWPQKFFSIVYVVVLSRAIVF